jgi:hypothetical protein
MISPEQIIVPKRRGLYKPAPVRLYTRDDVAGARRAFSDEELRRATVPPAMIGPCATVPVSATATDPLTIVTSKTPFFFLTADQGANVGTGGVSPWTDQSSAGNSATQTTNNNFKPQLSTTGGPNSRGIVTYDGSDDFHEFAGWNPPAPGTTNIWFFMVVKPVSWSSGANLYSGSSTSILRARMGTTTGTLAASNTTAGQQLTNFTVGSYYRVENLFSNSTNDYIKVGATATTIPGTNTGNTDAGAGVFRIATDILTRFGNIAVACFGAWNGEPTSTEKGLLSSWVTSWYGATVAV